MKQAPVKAEPLGEDGIPTALPGKVVLFGTRWGNLAEQLARYLPAGQLTVARRGEVVSTGEADVFALIPGVERVDGDVMDALPGLRLIQQAGVGVESVDIRAATERGIYVANVPSPGTGNAESVAELVLLHMLALARHLKTAEVNARTGVWGQPLGACLWGKTVGIYGLGGVGVALAQRLRPFGVRLVGIKRRPDPSLARGLGLAWLGTPQDRARLLAESDYVVLAASANDGVGEPFGLDDFRRMKRTAYFINVARGVWVDEAALVVALREGLVAGAGLDVFAREPLEPSSPLLEDGLNVILTPHLGGCTDVSYANIARAVAANILRVARGLVPDNCFNPRLG